MPHRDPVEAAAAADSIRSELKGWFLGHCLREMERCQKTMNHYSDAMSIDNRLLAGEASVRLKSWNTVALHAKLGTFFMERGLQRDPSFMTTPRIRTLREKAREANILVYDNGVTEDDEEE